MHKKNRYTALPESMTAAAFNTFIEQNMLEEQIHFDCVAAYNAKYSKLNALLMHVANEGIKATHPDKAIESILKGRVKQYNNKMERLGRIKGFPDFIFLYDGRLLLIELKKHKGILTGDQPALFERLKCAKHPVIICRSVGEFMSTIDQFINITYL